MVNPPNANIVVGTWKPISPGDQHIQEIAKFAVAEYGKRHGENMFLSSVETGQIVEVFLDGNNYYNLILFAKPGVESLLRFYGVIACENASKNVKKLVSFVPLT